MTTQEEAMREAFYKKFGRRLDLTGELFDEEIKMSGFSRLL